MFKKISTNTLLLRKRAPTLVYIAALTRQNSRIKGCIAGEKQKTNLKPWRGRRGHC
jgi:hypothetical protein